MTDDFSRAEMRLVPTAKQATSTNINAHTMARLIGYSEKNRYWRAKCCSKSNERSS